MLFEVSNDVRTMSEQRIKRRQKASKPRPQSFNICILQEFLSFFFHYPYVPFIFLSLSFHFAISVISVSDYHSSILSVSFHYPLSFLSSSFHVPFISLSVSIHDPFISFHCPFIFLSFAFSHFFRIDSQYKKHHRPEHHLIMTTWKTQPKCEVTLSPRQCKNPGGKSTY